MITTIPSIPILLRGAPPWDCCTPPWPSRVPLYSPPIPSSPPTLRHAEPPVENGVRARRTRKACVAPFRDLVRRYHPDRIGPGDAVAGTPSGGIVHAFLEAVTPKSSRPRSASPRGAGTYVRAGYARRGWSDAVLRCSWASRRSGGFGS